MYSTLAGILAARAAGYTSRSILRRLGATHPKWESLARFAEGAGFSSPTVLSRVFQDKKGHKDSEEFLTEHEKTKLADKRHKRKAAMGLLKAAGIAAGAYGAYKLGAGALARGATTLMPGGGQPPPGSGAPPQNPPPGVGGGANPLLGTPGTQTQAAQAATAPTASNIPPPFGGQPNQPQRAPFTPEQQQRAQGLEKLQGVAENLPSEIENQYPYLPIFVRKHIQAGVAPEEIYGQLQKSKMLAPILKKIEEQTGVPYLERINHLAGMVKGQQVPKPSKSQRVDFGEAGYYHGPNPEEAYQKRFPPKTIEAAQKSQEVITPSGAVGKVVDTKGDYALIDSNGRKQQVNLTETQPIPREWEHVHIDLSQVPEEDKSANLNFVAPTEDRKNLIVRFWEGKQSSKPIVYIYRRKDGEPIDEETLYNIANEVDAPITQGMKFAGAWSPTGKSRGGAFHKRMKILAQSIEDPDDPTKPYLFTRAPLTFEHGMWVAIKNEMIKKEEQFDAYYNPKKPKKPK